MNGVTDSISGNEDLLIFCSYDDLRIWVWLYYDKLTDYCFILVNLALILLGDTQFCMNW